MFDSSLYAGSTIETRIGGWPGSIRRAIIDGCYVRPVGSSELRAVVVHDFAETYGGAERVTREIALAFPDAPVYALLGRGSVVREMGLAGRFTSLLPPRPALLRHYRLMTPVLPWLADRARVPDADVVISSSYGFAHRVRSHNDAPRVCYCHSPLRFAWSMTERYRDHWARGTLSGRGFELMAAALRRSDLHSSRGIAAYLTQSSYVAERIERFYGVGAQVIGAPIDTDLFHPSGRPPSDYFLLCGRLVEPYFRAPVALDAFRRLPHLRLVVVGDGPAAAELRKLAPPNVEFKGRVSDAELVELMQGCQAALSPTHHDFGLIPLEVMACGRPVLAYAAGGALATVAPGMTGELFDEPSGSALAELLENFDPDRYDPGEIRRHAEGWDRDSFRERLVTAVESAAIAPPRG